MDAMDSESVLTCVDEGVALAALLPQMWHPFTDRIRADAKARTHQRATDAAITQRQWVRTVEAGRRAGVAEATLKEAHPQRGAKKACVCWPGVAGVCVFGDACRFAESHGGPTPKLAGAPAVVQALRSWGAVGNGCNWVEHLDIGSA